MNYSYFSALFHSFVDFSKWFNTNEDEINTLAEGDVFTKVAILEDNSRLLHHLFKDHEVVTPSIPTQNVGDLSELYDPKMPTFEGPSRFSDDPRFPDVATPESALGTKQTESSPSSGAPTTSV